MRLEKKYQKEEVTISVSIEELAIIYQALEDMDMSNALNDICNNFEDLVMDDCGLRYIACRVRDDTAKVLNSVGW